MRSNDLNERLKDFKPGDKVTLTVFRDEELRQFEVTSQAAAPEYQVQRGNSPTALQKKIYNSWLNAEWPEEKTETKKD